MDPNATWRMLAESYGSDSDHAKELAQALLYWLDKGGFPPKITGNAELDRIVAWNTCVAVAAR